MNQVDTESRLMWQLDPVVYVARAEAPSYEVVRDRTVPELEGDIPMTTTLVAWRELLHSAGLDARHFDTPEWNPLSELVPAGARVLLKPNWVRHPIPGRDDNGSLVTHTHVLDSVLAYLAKVPGCRVVIGDAPIQGCDFAELMAVHKVSETLDRYAGRFEALSVVDFRKTILGREGGDDKVRRDCRGDEHFRLFNLGADSLLEAITTPEPRFRVTVYNPDHLQRAHAPGHHEYLIAREVIEADVVISLPKLKTHKKAGLTGALKNMVGINGHKEYLPHHRLGGTADGGDCYPGRNRLKAMAEQLLDAGNRTEHRPRMRLAGLAAAASLHVNELLGGDDNLEGSWFGNDTVWRTCLDLQRILYYGKTDGTMAPTPQRLVLTLTDAIIGGQGEGPLMPTPWPAGLVTFGTSTAALDFVHALLMGLSPARIPLVHQAMRLNRWPLVAGDESRIRVRWADRWLGANEAGELLRVKARPPRGWQGHCEAAD